MDSHNVSDPRTISYSDLLAALEQDLQGDAFIGIECEAMTSVITVAALAAVMRIDSSAQLLALACGGTPAGTLELTRDLQLASELAAFAGRRSGWFAQSSGQYFMIEPLREVAVYLAALRSPRSRSDQIDADRMSRGLQYLAKLTPTYHLVGLITRHIGSADFSVPHQSDLAISIGAARVNHAIRFRDEPRSANVEHQFAARLLNLAGVADPGRARPYYRHPRYEPGDGTMELEHMKIDFGELGRVAERASWNLTATLSAEPDSNASRLTDTFIARYNAFAAHNASVASIDVSSLRLTALALGAESRRHHEAQPTTSAPSRPV